METEQDYESRQNQTRKYGAPDPPLACAVAHRRALAWLASRAEARPLQAIKKRLVMSDLESDPLQDPVVRLEYWKLA